MSFLLSSCNASEHPWRPAAEDHPQCEPAVHILFHCGSRDKSGQCLTSRRDRVKTAGVRKGPSGPDEEEGHGHLKTNNI